MSVRPVDIMTMQQINQVSNIKQNEMTRPMVEQGNIATVIEKQTEAQNEQVVKKTDVENRNKKYDARDKSENEYHGNNHKSEKKNEDGKVIIKSKKISNFDIKV